VTDLTGRVVLVSGPAPDMVAGLIALTPSGRIAEPAGIAALAVFLLSDACAAMTGQVVTVDGGQSVPLAALGNGLVTEAPAP
jgi:NAD(P)-dependent dehydrogenase (short-subunit alcohol dehydrogenase family)